MINRRAFLQAAIAAPAGLYIPFEADALVFDFSFPDFDPTTDYGQYWLMNECPTQIPPAAWSKVVDAVIENAENVVPPEYYDRVRLSWHPIGSSGTIDPLKEYSSVAWKYYPPNWRMPDA